MKLSQFIVSAGVVTGLTAISSASYAQTGGSASGSVSATGSMQVGNGTTPAALPAPRSDNDAAPLVAAPVMPTGGVISQAGIGGNTAYGRPGVVELGGSIGLTLAGDLKAFNISPSVGWFFTDNLQLSGIVDFRYGDTGTSSSTALNVLVEPSYHLPFSRSLFAFLGVGLGLGYNSASGAGFALAPRLGMNIMVGRSGILSPALQFVYTTSNIATTPQGTLIVGGTSFGLNVGYTVML